MPEGEKNLLVINGYNLPSPGWNRINWSAKNGGRAAGGPPALPPPSLVLASLQVIVAPLLKNLTFDFQFVLQLVWIPATNLATSSQHYSLKKINTIFRKALTDLTKTSKILSWSEWFIHCTWTSELVYCTDYQIQLKGNNRQKGEIGQISIEFLFFSSKLIKTFFQSLTKSVNFAKKMLTCPCVSENPPNFKNEFKVARNFSRQNTSCIFYLIFFFQPFTWSIFGAICLNFLGGIEKWLQLFQLDDRPMAFINCTQFFLSNRRSTDGIYKLYAIFSVKSQFFTNLLTI